MRKHYYPNNVYVPSENHLRILSAWRKHLSMKDTAAALGLAEQTVKNAMSTMRRRAQAPNSVQLVETFWAYIVDLEEGKPSRRRMRYQIDTEYRERQRAIAREGMRRIRAIYAGKREEVYNVPRVMVCVEVRAMVLEIHPGDVVVVESATGPLTRRAITGVVQGDRFDVVWASREEEWRGAHAEGRDPQAMAWPAEDVRLVSHHEKGAAGT